MKPTILIFTALLFFTSCAKKETTKDCETNNYGTIHVSFTDALVRHSILATEPGTTNFREKLLAIGVTSDTIHLAPNTWPLSISSIDNGGLAINQTSKTAITTKCSDETFSITF